MQRHIAIVRKFASLDHISGGRAGWNVVTSGLEAEAHNFGREKHFGHAERYRRAQEFTRVVFGLWDSWDDDAFIRDKESGRFFDPAKLHALEHKGENFSVKGPLNVPRPLQGYPVIVQAAASDDGRAFAAEFAEVIFSNHLTIESAQAYYADVKRRAQEFGRAPEHVKVLPGLSAIVGRTEGEARESLARLEAFVHPIVAREILATVLGGVDLSPYSLDGPLPELSMPVNAGQSMFEIWTSLARRENLTIRELGRRVAAARGKSMVVGTPQQIADHMEAWFAQNAADGFNIMPPYLPGALDDFVELVVPELQRRGLMRTRYEGSTLREHLVLPRPESRYRAAQSVPIATTLP